MQCHNASLRNDYSGPGIENPHPFAPADNLLCTTCHGGNGGGNDKVTSHIPPPPEIGDRENQENNRTAYFNRLTLTGIDKFPNYMVDGQAYTALDYLQFINPGDLRVVTQSRSCGACHSGHAECVDNSVLASGTGIFSGAMYSAGVENLVPENRDLHGDTAADLAFRPLTDVMYDPGLASVGGVGRLIEFPVFSVRGRSGPNDLFNNDLYNAPGLSDDQLPDNRVITGSPLANLYHEQVAFTCGDCHLGSAGANNRYGDFRSSGCTACHMQYSLDGRSRSGDPNVNTLEPLDPDDIDPPERSHIARHMIRSTAKTLPSGEQIMGIDDYACAGCHQGSNRTVMQYWGIRLDQNEDLRRGVQYPAQPDSHQDTRNDPRLFDPVIGNRTFNGRDRDQYILFEDYDGDGKDDTPPDVHYEAGLGCIDCHGSYDLHGGDVTNPNSGEIFSRMEQAVAIRCESCHGPADAYAQTATGVSYDGQVAELAVDAKGNLLKHVVKEGDDYFLTSRLTGQRHYIKQTLDTVVDSGTLHPTTGNPVYSAMASYAMGRNDNNTATGIGPRQTGDTPNGFSHSDNMSCASCHASWTNSCIGCHLEGEYNGGNNFSNITGERIVFREDEADFVYQSPVFFQLGVGPDNKIDPIAANTDTFFTWEDRDNVRSETFAFTDRNGGGNNPAAGYPSLSHNVMMPHSIRGKVTPTMEGPRYCVACHLTDYSTTTYQNEFNTLKSIMASPTFDGLDLPFFQVLTDHIGKNPGNQIDSPLWVHMVAGLGTGLFLFDKDGCPINLLDQDDERKGCDNGAPADNFDLTRVVFNLDRIVQEDGTSTGSNTHPLMEQGATPLGGTPNYSGPLGSTLIQKLTNDIILNSWVDAEGAPQGGAGGFVGGGGP